MGEFFDITDDYTDDLAFYADLAHANGKFLDLGSGTGRVSLHLAKLGATVVGVELSSEMLKRAETKTVSTTFPGSIEYVQGDMRDFSLPCTDFDVAFIAEYSFAYLYSMDDQLSCLRAVYSHMRPGGTLVVHMFLPNHEYFSSLGVGSVGGSVYEHTGMARRASGQTLLFSSTSYYSRSTQEIDSVSIFETIEDSGTSSKQVTPLRTHVVYPREMELLLHRAGMIDVSLFGDFNRGPLTDKSWEMIAVAKKPCWQNAKLTE